MSDNFNLVNNLTQSQRSTMEDIVLEFGTANKLLARYTHGPGVDDPMMMERDVNGNGAFDPSERYAYHADGLGSVTEITDPNGMTIVSYLYDSFGKLAQGGTGLLNPYTYTAREYDPESGLMHYRARTYDPSIGRFLQEDPILNPRINIREYNSGFSLEWFTPTLRRFPSALHPYIYVFNNPINLDDPQGEGVLDCIKCSYYNSKFAKELQGCSKEAQGCESFEANFKFMDKYNAQYESEAILKCGIGGAAAKDPKIAEKWFTSCAKCAWTPIYIPR